MNMLLLFITIVIPSNGWDLTCVIPAHPGCDAGNHCKYYSPTKGECQINADELCTLPYGDDDILQPINEHSAPLPNTPCHCAKSTCGEVFCSSIPYDNVCYWLDPANSIECNYDMDCMIAGDKDHPLWDGSPRSRCVDINYWKCNCDHFDAPERSMAKGVCVPTCNYFDSGELCMDGQFPGDACDEDGACCHPLYCDSNVMKCCYMEDEIGCKYDNDCCGDLKCDLDTWTCKPCHATDGPCMSNCDCCYYPTRDVCRDDPDDDMGEMKICTTCLELGDHCPASPPAEELCCQDWVCGSDDICCITEGDDIECNMNIDCCGDSVCDFEDKRCHTCGNTNTTCITDDNCCTDTVCIDMKCNCPMIGEPCSEQGNCCSDLFCDGTNKCCAYGSCEPPPDCQEEDEYCTANGDCCEGLKCTIQSFRSCDCEGGMISFTAQYNGNSNASITCYHDKDDIACQGVVEPGGVFTCALNTNDFDSFKPNTNCGIDYPDRRRLGSSDLDHEDICSIHTSCSRNIIGMPFEDCGDWIVISWTSTDDALCDEPENKRRLSYSENHNTCQPEPEPPECLPEDEICTDDGDCCEDLKCTFSSCDCDGGMTSFTAEYNGDSATTITCYYDKDDDEICQAVVAPGETFTCDVTFTGEFEGFKPNTNCVVASESDTCSIHTSCSRNIIGMPFEDCSDWIVISWTSADNAICDESEDDKRRLGSKDKPEDKTCQPEPECKDMDEVCRGNYDCCGDLECISSYHIDRGLLSSTVMKCSEPVPPPECLPEDYDCMEDADCCDGLTCTFRSCDCKGGMTSFTVHYDIATGGADASIICFRDKDKDIVCEGDDIPPGGVFTCDITTNGFDEFKSSTYCGITYGSRRRLGLDLGDETCSIHTSCSRDIIGMPIEDCDDWVVISWTSADGALCNEPEDDKRRLGSKDKPEEKKCFDDSMSFSLSGVGASLNKHGTIIHSNINNNNGLNDIEQITFSVSPWIMFGIIILIILINGIYFAYCKYNRYQQNLILNKKDVEL